MGRVLQKAFMKWKCKTVYGIVYPLNSTKYIPKEMFEKDPLKEYCVSSDKKTGFTDPKATFFLTLRINHMGVNQNSVIGRTSELIADKNGNFLLSSH